MKRDDEVLSILKENGVHGLEIAPKKIVPNLWDDGLEPVQAYLEKCKKHDIEVVAFQAILFGEPDLKVFQNAENRHKTTEYLKKMIELADKFGAKNLVFGSPKNRHRFEEAPDTAFATATDFFRELGDFAAENNTNMCIEPNPKEYFCDFINTSMEGAELVRAANSSGFKLHLDSGAMHMNGEDYEKVISENIDIISHFHISNPQLNGFQNTPVDHERLGKALKANNYQGWCSIEMLPNEDEIEGVKLALETALKYYK